MNQRISIRFFNDCEVRAAWDDAASQWRFSVADVIGVLTDSASPRKYWSVLKSRLKQTHPQLTTNCSQLKMTANDGKRYLTDCLAQKEIIELAGLLPGKNTAAFIQWLTYGNDTIDGKSRDKAYVLFESGLLESMEAGSVKCLQQIHGFIFGGLYDFAGKLRQKNISKGGFSFANWRYFDTILPQIEQMPENTFPEIINKYVEMNVAHPFMEGNGRASRIWLDLMLKHSLKKCIDWSKVNKKTYLEAMETSVLDSNPLKSLLQAALTDQIYDRELFMKGIDYSYYYESEDLTPEPENQNF